MKRPPAAEPLSAEEFQALTGVSDSAMAGLRTHVALVAKWQPRINLVGADSQADVWRRHVLDSAQLFRHLPPAAETVADIGSGAGFPGMVMAIIGAATGTGRAPEVHLIESNGRKCAFLGEVARETGAGAVIHHSRVEKVRGISADVVTARAVGSLEKLLQYANPLLKKGGQCLFPRGQKWRDELTELKKNWIISESEIRSLSDPSGMILKLEAISRRDRS